MIREAESDIEKGKQPRKGMLSSQNHCGEQELTSVGGTLRTHVNMHFQVIPQTGEGPGVFIYYLLSVTGYGLLEWKVAWSSKHGRLTTLILGAEWAPVV